ncbi:hypothetical protein DU478_20570 [Thalassococcus profundi]|uniref:Uncharacterized protein n=1 Tax=Thalassococcus profundi TaxID=2282382 RepID=A0A369TGG1_9RHOB|nr:hypothetical protein [Thalassococcus profundi]RDD64393.1 hypothetical protein DU478_20570 [Thalassococcus profundi]
MPRLLPAIALASLLPLQALAQNVITSNTTIRDQLCVGPACLDTETYDAVSATLRLRSFANRIDFIDTDNAFPDTDWQLKANDDTGPDDRFMIRDLTAGTTPVSVRGGAPDNSLYVAPDGKIGMGTLIPQAELHVETTTLSGIRLNRSNADFGLGQAWETVIFSNGDFGLSDITNTTTPFAMRPGTPNNAIFLEFDTAQINTGRRDYNFEVRWDNGTSFWADGGTGDIGMGTLTPTAPLHLQRTNGTAEVLVENTTASPAGARGLFTMRNNGGSFFTLDNTDAGTTWFFTHENASPNRFIIADAVADGPEFTLTAGGDVTIPGNFISGNTTLNVPDYVFEDGYALRPLSEVAAFIGTNRHLPEVPSAAEIAAQGLDMTDMQMRLLKKVEELTLYTLEQQEIIDTQKRRLQAQEAETADLRAELAALRGLDARLARLEAAAAE